MNYVSRLYTFKLIGACLANADFNCKYIVSRWTQNVKSINLLQVHIDYVFMGFYLLKLFPVENYLPLPMEIRSELKLHTAPRLFLPVTQASCLWALLCANAFPQGFGVDLKPDV